MIELHGDRLQLSDVVRVAREREPVRVAPTAIPRIQKARAFLEKCVREGRVLYGVNTGIGHLAGVPVSSEDLEALQVNIVRSHAAGVGPPLDDDETRAILLLKLNLFAKGNSGVRVDLVQQLERMLEHDVLPVIPSKGSLGASGDLAPLAHVALVVMGEGEARLNGRELAAADALRAVGIPGLRLSYKEGLGLINGCQVMAARGTLLAHDARVLLRTATVLTAGCLEIFGASERPFDARVHTVRPYPGQSQIASHLRLLLQGRVRRNDRVQDAYSLRCSPQILGGISDAFDDLERRLAVEINAASDNPLVFADDEEVVAAGNFHGQSLAIALDGLGIALAEVASLAERQMNRLLNPALSQLPAFLAPATGKNSGLMILQYTSAALVSENKVLAHPASVDSIPVSADQEDHVSMGATSAHKAKEIYRNTADVLAAHALVVAQAMDLSGDKPFAPAVEALRKSVRSVVPFWGEDRYASGDLRAARRLVETGQLLAAVERVTGEVAP